MTVEEVAAWEARVAALYTTGFREDAIVAILMDMRVGNAGDREETARVKAQRILALLDGAGGAGGAGGAKVVEEAR